MTSWEFSIRGEWKKVKGKDGALDEREMIYCDTQYAIRNTKYAICYLISGDEREFIMRDERKIFLIEERKIITNYILRSSRSQG